MKHTLYRLRTGLERNAPKYIDLAIAPLVDAQNTVLVTGFWRSGTTFFQRLLAEQLCAKTIFEPLETDVRRLTALGQVAPARLLPKARRAHMPFFEDVIPREAPLHGILTGALRAQVGGKRVRVNRVDWREAFRRRVVVKLVRGQLAVVGMQRTFGSPVVHLYRDPRAVLASIARDHWGRGWLEEMSLREELLVPDDGRAEFFGQWEERIMHLDNEDWIARITGYWALTEKYVAHCAETYQVPHQVVQYETVVRSGERAVASIAAQVGAKRHNPVTPTNMLQSSPTTVQSRADASTEARLYGWRDELPRDVTNRIMEIVQEFGLGSRLYGD